MKGLAHDDPRVLATLTQMTVGTLERSGLDDETNAIVRIAAMVASEAAPAPYLVNLGAADEVGIPLNKVSPQA